MQRDLIQLASTDPLTGAFNRRAFFHTSEEICRVATEIGTAVSAIMLDVDHFKRVNDEYGHDVGDAVLKGIAQEISHVDDAVFGRLGGEEFALVLDQCAPDEAEEISEGLRSVIEALSFPSPRGDVSLTCSFGVASFRTGDTVDAMLKRADLALYEAKAGGRNRVVVSTETGDIDFERPGGVLRSSARPDGAMDAAE
jgi:diguanylate cyclase (GGDEF)-like protein